MGLSPSSLLDMLSSITERQQLLEYFLRGGPSFNVASVADVKDLRRRIGRGGRCVDGTNKPGPRAGA